MAVDSSEWQVKMDEFEDYMREREENPIDPTWLQSEGQEHLDKQFDVEGVDDFGNPSAFQQNDFGYDMWKAATGKSTERMQKDGRLKEAVANAQFDDERDGDEIKYTWSWSVWNDEGINYAYIHQHENEGDATGDRKLRLDKRWVSDIAAKWAAMERRRIEEIWE